MPEIYVIRRIYGTHMPDGAHVLINLEGCEHGWRNDQARGQERIANANDIPTTAAVKRVTRCPPARGARGRTRAFRNAMPDSSNQNAMQFDNAMTLRKISFAAALFLFSLATPCAESTQLLCKATESMTGYFPKGKAIEVPVDKLAEAGTEYVVRGWHFSNDILRVSRSSGEFSYATATSRFDHPARASGVCEAKQQKLRF